MTTDEGHDGDTIRAVERSLAIVDALREAGSATVTEVAEELDYSTSTVHVHLRTLESEGYAVRTEEGYAPSLKFLRAGTDVQRSYRLYRVGREELERVAAETGEVATFGVEEDGQRVVLAKAEGSDAVYDNNPVGERTRMHWTALGKSLLAHLPRQRVDDIVDRYGLPEMTDRTITDRDALADELERIRSRGYAVEDEERREGIRAAGVPIRVDDETVGALAVAGPANRLTDERIESEILDHLTDAANVVEVKYRYEDR